jgi:hypothetical protein
MNLLNAAAAEYFLLTNRDGCPETSDAVAADHLHRTIAGCYEYIDTWSGRGLPTEEIPGRLEAIGVLKLGYFHLTGKAWVA